MTCSLRPYMGEESMKVTCWAIQRSMTWRRTAISAAARTSNVLAVPRPITGTWSLPSERHSMPPLPLPASPAVLLWRDCVGAGPSGPSLHAAGEQDLHHLSGYVSGVLLQLSIGAGRERMRHIDHRVIRHTPHSRGGLAGSHKVIGANSRSWDTGAVHMNAVVHTARAARASIAYPDDGEVARLGPLRDQLGRHGLGGRRFTVPYNVAETILLIEEGRDHL